MSKHIHIHIGGKTKDAASASKMNAALLEIEKLCRKIKDAISEEEFVRAAGLFRNIEGYARDVGKP